MSVHLKNVKFDNSGSARIRIFGSISRYTVHYVKNSETPVNHQICPVSTDDKSKCSFCSYTGEKESEKVSTYDRFLCLCWDFNLKKWACVTGPEGMFREIRAMFNNKRFSKQDILDGKTPDVLLQRIGKQISSAMIDESLGVTDTEIKKPIPSEDDLKTYTKKVSALSIWGYKNYKEALEIGKIDLGVLPEYYRHTNEPHNVDIRIPDNQKPKKKVCKLTNNSKSNFRPSIPEKNTDTWDII